MKISFDKILIWSQRKIDYWFKLGDKIVDSDNNAAILTYTCLKFLFLALVILKFVVILYQGLFYYISCI